MLTYRRWRVGWDISTSRPVLYSLFEDSPWESDRFAAHVSPVKDCRSGIYSYVDPGALRRERWGYELSAVGAVDAYGAVVVHEDNVVRSEHVRILALAIEPVDGGCEHRVAQILTGLFFLRHRTHYKLVRCGCRYGGWWSPEPAVELPLARVEETLLARYGVPRLPDGVTPSAAGGDLTTAAASATI